MKPSPLIVFFLPLQTLNNILHDLLGARLPAQVRRHELALLQIRIDRLIHRIRGLRQIQKLQHDTDTANCGDGVRDALALDIGCGAMARLADDNPVADVRGGHETQRADQRRGTVTQKIAVQVRCHDHVVVLRLQEQLVDHGVHDLLLHAERTAEFRLRQGLPGRGAEQAVRLAEHVALVRDRHQGLLLLLLSLAAHPRAPRRNLARNVRDAPARFARDALDRFRDLCLACRVGRVGIGFLFLHVQIFRVFTHDHQVNWVRRRRCEGRREGCLAGAHVRVQGELFAQGDNRRRVACYFCCGRAIADVS